MRARDMRLIATWTLDTTTLLRPSWRGSGRWLFLRLISPELSEKIDLFRTEVDLG